MPYPRNVTIIRTAVLLGAILGLGTGCGPSSGNSKVPAGANSSGGLHATIDTERGAIDIEFLPEDAPKAVENP
jgi:hypothetical protein